MKENKQNSSGNIYLLIHGAAHGAWAWRKVVPLLESAGHKAVAIDLPGHGQDKSAPDKVSLDDYVQKVVDVAETQSGPIILIGHSSGGVTIAQVSERLGIEKVEKLIFLDAFLPNNGESVFSLAGKFLPPAANEESTFSDSFIFDPTGATFTFDTTKVSNFLYHDCNQEDQDFAKENLGPQPVAPLATPVRVTDAIYGIIPKFYIVCLNARNGNMSEMSKNVPTAKTATLRTSHSPFFSDPDALVDLITSLG
ncbi:alpha/beta fold hydrolase [Dyadobacter fermentans]|uniref:alpha/beta fold hydrolase n=1 Tax=Dyadobacter fermentans TaxID=94254 RepID=UPI001CBC1783|nr:alpha/beta fold hydrolase [Dyadobacter fermentans]MBZ1357190.1 alpha/beta fold hydrolase [Dyadobacter fermentans]